MRGNKYIAISALIVFVWAFFVFVGNYNFGFLESVYSALSLFFANLNVENASADIYIPAILAIVIVVSAIVRLYISLFNKGLKRADFINDKSTIVVIGLDEGNRAYINSEVKDGNRVLAIEQDRNRAVEHYGTNVYVEHANVLDGDVLKELKVADKKHIVISCGDDLLNINIAKEILNINPKAKIYLHLVDRNLREFNKKGGVLEGENIKVYSYYEQSAKELFATHDIDGNSNKVINSHNSYAIAVIGNNSLSLEVIAQASIMAQLPNENKLTIYCIDSDAKSFEDSVKTTYKSLDLIKNIEFKFIQTNPSSQEFYTLAIWQENITNIIFCYEDDQKNLDLALNLTNISFLEQAVDKTLNLKMHIALSNSGKIGEHIDKNREIFSHIYIFAQTQRVSDREFIVDKSQDNQAIAINYIYNNIGAKLVDYDKYVYEFYSYYEDKPYSIDKMVDIDIDNWQKLSYFKKESNRAVAEHMKVKLKYLGLKAVKSSKTEKLFEHNYKLFNQKLNENHLIKLAKCEHNRWNTFHFLQGFKPIEFINSKAKKARDSELENKKQHICLIDFEDFKNRSEELEKLGYEKGNFEGYDILIVQHIPHILTFAGYKLVEF